MSWIWIALQNPGSPIFCNGRASLFHSLLYSPRPHPPSPDFTISLLGKALYWLLSFHIWPLCSSSIQPTKAKFCLIKPCKDFSLAEHLPLHGTWNMPECLGPTFFQSPPLSPSNPCAIDKLWFPSALCWMHESSLQAWALSPGTVF